MRIAGLAAAMILAMVWPRIGTAGEEVSPLKAAIRQLSAPEAATRSQAAEALGKAAPWQLTGMDKEDATALAVALTDADPAVRRIASNIFMRVTHTAQGAALSRPFVETLAAALHDTEAAVAGNAATALGHIRDPAARRPLIDALSDERGPVAGAATGALGHLLDASSARELVPSLRDERARPHVRSLFRKLAGEGPVLALVAALEDQDLELRRGAAFVLEELASPPAEAALLRALKDGDAQVRASAARALGRLGARDAGGAVIPLLQDSDAKVRMAGVQALRSVGGPEAVEPLIARLQDAESAIRLEAVGALAKIGDDRGVPPMIALLGDDEIGDSLFHVLGHWQGNRSVVRSLIEAMASADEQVSRRAARNLSVDNGKVLLLGREAVGPLLSLLKNRQVEVRQAASFSLRTLGEGHFLDQHARGPLSEASRDEDLQVQRNVAKALELLRAAP